MCGCRVCRFFVIVWLLPVLTLHVCPALINHTVLILRVWLLRVLILRVWLLRVLILVHVCDCCLC